MHMFLLTFPVTILQKIKTILRENVASSMRVLHSFEFHVKPL